MDDLTRQTLQYKLKEKKAELDEIPLNQFTYNPQIQLLINEIKEIQEKLKEDKAE